MPSRLLNLEMKKKFLESSLVILPPGFQNASEPARDRAVGKRFHRCYGKENVGGRHEPPSPRGLSDRKKEISALPREEMRLLRIPLLGKSTVKVM